MVPAGREGTPPGYRERDGGPSRFRPAHPTPDAGPAALVRRYLQRR